MAMENDENGYKLVVLQYKSDALEGLNAIRRRWHRYASLMPTKIL